MITPLQDKRCELDLGCFKQYQRYKKCWEYDYGDNTCLYAKAVILTTAAAKNISNQYSFISHMLPVNSIWWRSRPTSGQPSILIILGVGGNSLEEWGLFHE